MAAARGLLARIASGDPLARRDSKRTQESVIEHLRYVLNTRLGEAPAAVDYGVEDLSDLTNSFPEAISIWEKSIRATVEKYEPRLTQVRIWHRANPDVTAVSFEIRARLIDENGKTTVTLQTTVDTAGQFEVW